MALRRKAHPTTALAFALVYGAFTGPSWSVLLTEPYAVLAFGGAPSPASIGSSTVGSRGSGRSALRPRCVGRHRLASDSTSRGWGLRPKLLDRNTFDRCYCTRFRDQDDDKVGEEEKEGGHGGEQGGRRTLDGAWGVVTDVEGGNAAAAAEGDNGRRITTALELMETLMKSDVDVLKSLQVFSPALGGGGDRVVGEIARPILARAKRYKAPRVEYEKRQAARKVAEADPFRSVYVYRGGSPDPKKVPVDIRPRARVPPPARQRTSGRNEVRGRGELSKRAKDARARWENPEYRENILSKRKKTIADRKKKLEADPAHQSDEAEPLPATVEQIDVFLNATSVTADEATRAYEMLSQGERTRREKISLRWKDPAKWLAGRMAEEASKRRRLSDPAYLRQRKEARSLKAKRAYAVRCANGNSGKGRPRSRVDQAKALAEAVETAAARDALMKAGLATAADFEEKPKVKKVPKNEIPTVTNRRGRPRKLRTKEEKAALAFREANGPRPRGRPRKLPLNTNKKPPASSPVSASTVAASLTNAVKGWMAEAAAKAAEEFPGMPPAVGPQVEALAISRTKEMTGAQTGEWTPQMTNIAAAGVEAWSQAWEAVSAAAAAEAEDGPPPTGHDQAMMIAEVGAAEASATSVGESQAKADDSAAAAAAGAAADATDVALKTAPAASLRRPKRLSG